MVQHKDGGDLVLAYKGGTGIRIAHYARSSSDGKELRENLSAALKKPVRTVLVGQVFLLKVRVWPVPCCADSAAAGTAGALQSGVLDVFAGGLGRLKVQADGPAFVAPLVQADGGLVAVLTEIRALEAAGCGLLLVRRGRGSAAVRRRPDEKI